MSYSYLALGDSYTIGEQVPIYESFPCRLVQMLRAKGISFHAPDILAKTAWATHELTEAIGNYSFLPKYDLVTLLIGVNNQYRAIPVADFEAEFLALLQKSIHFAGDFADNVFVLSIPDWGISPFAADRDRLKIALEIDEYNKVCQRFAALYNVDFIDVTTSQRIHGSDPSYFLEDGLHPSGLEYNKWALMLAERIVEKLGK